MTTGLEAHQGMLVSGRFPELEDALCERVRELKRGRPLAPITIVVGSGAARTRVSDLLVRRLEAVANVEVVTLSKLARDRVARAQSAPPAVLGPAARERLVRRLVEGQAPSLAYFGSVAGRPHFAAALAATFADLREATVAPGSAWARAVAAVSGGAGRAADRAADLERLYAGYCADLAALAACDGAGLLRQAAGTWSTREGPVAAGGRAAATGAEDRHVIVYGIYDLNVAQEELFRSLLASGADAFVPLPHGVAAGQGNSADGDRAADRAQAIAVGLACGRDLVTVGAPSPRADKDRLAGVWASGGTTVGGRELGLVGDGTLEVVSVADERAEAREAARAVLAAAERGAAFWDCAVVVPHGADVQLMARALRGAGLPVACRRPDRSQGAMLLARLVDCLSPPAGEPFSRRAVVDLLGVAPLHSDGAAPEEKAVWLDEAREAGVVAGADEWVERVSARRRSLERLVERLEADENAVPDDEGDGGRLERARLRLRAARALQPAVRRLAGAAAELPERASWPEWAGVFARLVEAVFAREPADAAVDAAGRLHTLAVLGEEVDLRTVAETLRDLLGGETVQEGRVGRDGVAVVTPLELRGLGFSTIVFTGLAEGGFPVRARPDPILGDAARRSVTEALGVRLPLAEDRDAESLLLFGFACEAARERLVLVAPRSAAATGRPRLPSRLLLRIASLAAGPPVGLDEFLSGRPLAAVWRHVGGAPAFGDAAVWVDERERDVAALSSLSTSGRRSAAREYLRAVLEAPGMADERLGGRDARLGAPDAAARRFGAPGSAARRLGAWRASRSPSSGPWDGLLGEQARAALAARHPFHAELHPTSLERYITCPFTFLLRTVYGLQAPEEPGESLEMDPKEFGSLAHAILEDLYAAVISDDLGLDAALEALEDAWQARCAEAEGNGATGAALAWRVRRDVLLADLRQAVGRDPVFKPDGGRPAGVEWRFGDRYANAVPLDLGDGRRVRFSGRLDRVDRTPGGARVIDYKTGAGFSERQRLKDGLSVQLPVYQLAVRHGWGDLAPGTGEPGEVSSVYRLVTRRGEFEDLPLPDDEAATQARLRALVADALALVDAGLFPRSNRGQCDYCDVRYACGVSEWARARKREQEALAPVVALQSPGKAGGLDA